jgi:hypothetical protein
LWTKVFVFEADNRLIADSKAIVSVGLEGYFALVCIKSRTADAGIDGFVVGVFVGRVHHAGEVFAAAMARVDVSSYEELVKGFTV